MRKGQQKFISLLLVLMCFLSCINTGTVFARAGTVTDHQAIVLVLDTSGSMDGTPIINLKNAALEFCKKILDSDKNNQIAIVAFASSQKTYDFSNNLTELEQNISSFDANGGTNMENAIKSADTLLQKDAFKNGYAKSIVLCSDGIPQSGGTSSNGQYTNKDSNYYKYANYVYNIAHKIMTKGSNIYTLGFFHNLYGQDLEFANRFMNDIQNGGYFEANNVGDLIDEFVKIAHDILNPFTITLTHEEISYNENTETPGSYTYKYKINASVKNANPKPAKNVKLAINLDEGVILSVGSQQEITIDTLDENDTKEFTWNVELPMIVLGVTPYKEYSVTASSDNTVDITSYDKIIIDTHDIPSPKNNELDFSKDIWSFGNFGGPLYISEEDKGALLLNLKDNEKADIKKEIDKTRNYSDNQGGHCWGMSVTTVLSKMGIINPCLRYNGAFPLHNANCLHDITMNPSNDSNIESLITFYQLTPSLDKIGDEADNYIKKSNIDKIKSLTDMANDVKNGGTPFVIWFIVYGQNSDGTINREECETAHAITGYAYEPGNYTYDNHNYNGRILIYDSNFVDTFKDEECLYINSNTGDWNLPSYTNANSNSRGDLVLVTNNLELLSTKDIDTSASNYNAVLEANSKTRFIVKNKNGSYNSKDIFDNKINGFRTYFLPQGSSSAPQISMPNNLDYTIENVNKNDVLDYNINYRGNSFLSANATTADSVNFCYNGQVGLTNNEEDYCIASTVNNGPLQWYTINVSGEKTANPTLTPTKQGFVFEGNTMDNITVTGTGDTETKELTFSTTENNVFIGESNNELTVSIDKDKDGTYETVIADSGKKNTEKKTAELKNLETENFTLTPAFVATVRDYTSTVDYSVSKVSLTPTLEKGTKATISVNGSKAVAFDGKQAIDLKVGKNKIEIVVSGKNLTNNIYTIIVTRSKAEEIKAQNTNSNKTNYTDKSPKTGNYIAKMSLVTAFVLVSLGIILFTHLRFKAKRKKNL